MNMHDTLSKTAHKPLQIDDDNLIKTPSASRVDQILHLQQTIGNQAVQRLMVNGQLDLLSSTRPSQHTVQRQCGCGCANCSGEHEDAEQNPLTTVAQTTVQRAEDEENDSGNWLSNTVSGIADTVGGWFGGNDNEDTNLKNIPQVTAKCKTDEETGHGDGEGRSISLHGVTNADFNKGEPMPEPFPDTVNVETFDAGNGQQGFNAHGTFDATFDARTNVTLPPVPDGLTPCQTEAVQTFIDGPLTDHENDHVSAFRDNYDGDASITVSVDRILDTPSNRRNAMQNPLATEHNRRRELAVNASDALDPWNQNIPGLDCEDE